MLSVCIVVYNNEKVIRRCLESIKNIADEIIIVLDGEQKDNTYKICRQYTNKIFSRKHVGFSEPHFVFAFQQAAGSWIMKIDADEFFLPQSLLKIKDLMRDKEIDGYSFLWRLWDGKKYITKNKPYKPVLFRKSKLFFIGVPHGAMQSYGKVKNIKINLEHQPYRNKWCWKSFKTTEIKRTHIQAKFLLRKFSTISKFNYFSHDYPLSMRIRKKLCFLFPLFAIYKFVSSLSKGEKSKVAIKVSLQMGLYEFYLGYFICLEKLKKL